MRSSTLLSAAALCLMLAFPALTGCASSAGTLTASPSGTNTVSVGDEVLIRLPASTNLREWRLTQFDSAKLPITQQLRLATSDTEGQHEWLARFVARIPGQAEVEFVRVSAGASASGTIGERRRYRFRIRN